MIVNALCQAQARLPLRATQEEGSVAALKPRTVQACMDTAKRFVSGIQRFRNEGKDSLLAVMREEKKKNLKFAFSLVASGIAQENVASAFANAGLSEGETPRDAMEAAMLACGARLAIGNVHPIAVMRAMTAYLGFSVFDEAGAWLATRFLPPGRQEEELLLPGELADAVYAFTDDPGSLGQAVRLAGLPLLAAALAGCPDETVATIKSVGFNALGSALLDDEMRNARTRLSSDELSDAQHAFLTLLGSLKELVPKGIVEEEAWKRNMDEGLVGEVSELVLDLDERILKTVISGMDAKSVAALIQAMEPIAHDRLFSCVTSNRGKKILDALEASSPLGVNELTRRAQMFAQKVLAEIAPKSKALGKALPIPARVRHLLSAILSRE
ncbi:MAG: hypothetical protein AB1407_02610 [Spirochaetota bacterium]